MPVCSCTSESSKEDLVSDFFVSAVVSIEPERTSSSSSSSSCGGERNEERLGTSESEYRSVHGWRNILSSSVHRTELRECRTISTNQSSTSYFNLTLSVSSRSAILALSIAGNLVILI